MDWSLRLTPTLYFGTHPTMKVLRIGCPNGYVYTRGVPNQPNATRKAYIINLKVRILIT